MRRRDLLKAVGASVATLAAPRLGHGAERVKTLIFVGVADLSTRMPRAGGTSSSAGDHATTTKIGPRTAPTPRA
jgi:hypothetical protein